MAEKGFNPFKFRRVEKGTSSQESKEVYTPARLGDIMFWSFLMSRGDSSLQRDALHAALYMNPKMTPALRTWGDQLQYRTRKHEEFTEEEKHQLALAAAVDENPAIYSTKFSEISNAIAVSALQNDPVAAALVERMQSYVYSQRHPRGPRAPNGEEARSIMNPVIISETRLRLGEFFQLAAYAPVKISTSEKEEVIGRYADHSLVKDYRSLERYKDGQSKFGHEPSMLAAYALSASRKDARKFLPEEFQSLWEASGKHVRSHWTEYPIHNRDAMELEPTQEKLLALVTEWKNQTGEDIHF